MTDIPIRPAKPSDASAVQEVARASWHAAYDDFLGADAVDEMIDEWYGLDDLRDGIEREDHVFVVADAAEDTTGGIDPDRDVGADVSGFAHVGPSAEREAWNLFRLYVTPAFWGDGIGTALLDQVEREMKDRGAPAYELAVLAENEVGVSFYESRGFDRFDETATELAGVEATEYWYRKKL